MTGERTNFGFPNPSFAEAVGGKQEQLRSLDIDLSVARSKAAGTMLEVYQAGTFIFCAQDAFDSDTVVSAVKTVGKAFMRLNQNIATPILLRAGQQFNLGPFERLYIENAAQAGKMIRLYFSTGPLILPFSSDINIAGAVTSSESINPEGASFASLNPGAAGVTQLLAAASNVNGVKLRSGLIVSWATLYADTAAPTGAADTTKRAVLACNSGSQIMLPFPLLLAAGVGIWFAAGAAGPYGNFTWDVL